MYFAHSSAPLRARTTQLLNTPPHNKYEKPCNKDFLFGGNQLCNADKFFYYGVFTKLSSSVFCTRVTRFGGFRIFPIHTLLHLKAKYIDSTIYRVWMKLNNLPANLKGGVHSRYKTCRFYAKESLWFSCAKRFILLEDVQSMQITKYWFIDSKLL